MVLTGVLLVVAAVSVIMVLLPRTAPMPEAFAEGVSLTQAIERAREERRVVVAVATADWCGPCQAFKRGALAEGAVREWLEANSVAVMVDVTSEAPADAEFLQIGPIPTTYVISGDGGVVGRTVGNMGSDELMVFLRGHAPSAIGVSDEHAAPGEG